MEIYSLYFGTTSNYLEDNSIQGQPQRKIIALKLEARYDRHIHRKIVSAKDANDGDTVYLTSRDAWTRDISVAELLTSDDFDWRLALAQRLREVFDATLTNPREGEHGLLELAV